MREGPAAPFLVAVDRGYFTAEKLEVTSAENPEAVKGFLRAFLKGLKDTVASPTHAIESVLRRNEDAKKEVEVERLQMAIRDNILTMEVRTNGYGGVDIGRFEQAIDQIGLAHKLSKTERGGYLRCVVSSASWRTMGSLISNAIGGIALVSFGGLKALGR